MATHWIFIGPKGGIATEKLRPMLKALFPKKQLWELDSLAGSIYRSGSKGYRCNDILIYRRVEDSIYYQAAQTLRKGKANPFLSEAASFT
jgi:hypothetical protein